MDKNRVFACTVLAEAVVTFLTFIPFGRECIGCYEAAKYSLMNPFGMGREFEDNFICDFACRFGPHPAFYFLADLMIATIILWIIYTIFHLSKHDAKK